MSSKLTTDEQRARRQTAQRLLRIREASGVSQSGAAKRASVSRRAIVGIERADHRMTALQLFLDFLDLVLATKGLDAALTAILTEEQRHAAFGGNPRGATPALSHQTKQSDPGAHGGLYAAKDSVAGCGAETSALKLNAHESGPRAKDGWRSNSQSGVAQPGSALGITPEVARSNRVTAPSSSQTAAKEASSAQQVESAGWSASGDTSPPGSTAELGGAAVQPVSFPKRVAA